MKEKPLHLRLVSPRGVWAGGGGAGACHSPCHSRWRAPRVRAPLRSALPSLSDFTTPRKRRTGNSGLFLAQLWVPGNTGRKVRKIPTGPPLECSHPPIYTPYTTRSLQGQADTTHCPGSTVRPTKNAHLSVACSLGLDRGVKVCPSCGLAWATSQL